MAEPLDQVGTWLMQAVEGRRRPHRMAIPRSDLNKRVVEVLEFLVAKAGPAPGVTCR